MGVLFTAYDLLPYFGIAVVLVLARRRRFAELPLALAGLVAPSLAVVALLAHAGVGWTNKNTVIYEIIARAYLHPPALATWFASVSDVLSVLVANFFYSSVVFLPALFLAVVIVVRQPLAVTEGALLAAGAALFLFNNLAPPYEGRWQMRGLFIPRIYQPIFVALLVYVARAVGGRAAQPGLKRRLLAGACVVAFVGNASIVFGPLARVPWADYAYHRFYMHSGPGEMERQLALHGRRPLGFCARGEARPAGSPGD
jgi:hypothetical protein